MGARPAYSTMEDAIRAAVKASPDADVEAIADQIIAQEPALVESWVKVELAQLVRAVTKPKNVDPRQQFLPGFDLPPSRQLSLTRKLPLKNGRLKPLGAMTVTEVHEAASCYLDGADGLDHLMTVLRSIPHLA